MASDIGVRSLIMNDIMPSLVCRYLKVSVMGEGQIYHSSFFSEPGRMSRELMS